MRTGLGILLLICSTFSWAQETDILRVNLLNDSTEWYQVEVFKIYLSDIEFHMHDGRIIEQKKQYHLLDFNDQKTIEIELDSSVKYSELKGIHLTQGTDSLINVSGAFDGDLDPIHGMYWAWNSGYINIKLEGRYTSTRKTFEYHIGGYSGETATSRWIWLPLMKDSGKFEIDLDLEKFLSGTDEKENNAVMSPGIEAARLAAQFEQCFFLNE